MTYHWTYPVTPIEALFYGHVPIARGCAFLEFSKGGMVQRMMHKLKYDGNMQVGLSLGEMFGHRLQDERFLDSVNLIVPIPLHPSRERRRGYNQSAVIGQGLSKAMSIIQKPDALVRRVATESQTKRKRFERFKNTERIFSCPRPDVVAGKHVLLVDDVVTTGSTLAAGVFSLLDAGADRVSVAALAHPT